MSSRRLRRGRSAARAARRDRPGAVQALVGLADPRVQLAAAAVGEALVGGVPEEGMPEAERACRVRIALDELAEPVPGRRVGRGGRVVREHLGHELRAERRAQHGRVAEQRAVAGREPVDTRRDDGLDALRKRLVLGRLRGADELLEEQRVAAGPVGDRRDLVLKEPLGRRCADELACGFGLQRLRAGSSSPGSAARSRPRRSRPSSAFGSRTGATVSSAPGGRGGAAGRRRRRPSSGRPRSRPASAP